MFKSLVMVAIVAVIVMASFVNAVASIGEPIEVNSNKPMSGYAPHHYEMMSEGWDATPANVQAVSAKAHYIALAHDIFTTAMVYKMHFTAFFNMLVWMSQSIDLTVWGSSDIEVSESVEFTSYTGR